MKLYKCIRCLITRGLKASMYRTTGHKLMKRIYIVNNMGAIKIEIDSSVSLIQIIVNT